MAVVDKLVLKDPSNTDVEYDIGASAQNVSYTDGSTPTTVKGKLDSINTNHINVNILGSEAHGIKGVKTGPSGNEKYSIEVKDGNNWYPIESGGLPETPLSIQHGGTGNTVGYIQTGQTAINPAGSNATAEGYNTNAKGDTSHAEGVGSQAEGNCAHAEGYYASAVGNSSHAGGHYTYAGGADSFVHGKGEPNHILGNGYNEGAFDADASFIIGDARHNKFENIIGYNTYTQNAPGFSFGVSGKDDTDSSTESSPRDGFYGWCGVIKNVEEYINLAPFGIYLLFALVMDQQQEPSEDPTTVHHGIQMISTPALGTMQGQINIKGAGNFKITPVISYDGSNFTVTPKDNQGYYDDPVLKIANANQDGLAQIRLIRIA